MTIIQNRHVHKVSVVDFMSTLQSVQLNPSELCNRTCSFCPRADSNLYKNKKEFISQEVISLVGQSLNEFKFQGRIGFVGFGEPLLDSSIINHINLIRKTCPSAQWIEINTNGDFLTRDLVKNFYDAGLTDLTVSMYDSDESEKFNEMVKDIPVRLTLRHSYNQSNLVLVDRLGIMKSQIKNINKECYIPFYKLFIDYNGDYLLCDQDWGRLSKQYNIKNVSIKEFWTNKLNDYRLNLVNGERFKNIPCNSCDINGTMLGEESFSFIKNTISS